MVGFSEDGSRVLTAPVFSGSYSYTWAVGTLPGGGGRWLLSLFPAEIPLCRGVVSH